MKSIPQTQRYLPHEITTREHAVKTYRSGNSIAFVCRKYKISKASLMRWNKRYDGTRESLMNRSHRPHTPHPKQHTDEELKMIKNILRRNPDISGCELYGKLKKKGYSRHPDSLYRVLRRLGYRDSANTKKKDTYVPKPYYTPENIGVKWQLDVKYVPTHCYTGKMPDKFYQYTIIDEASRQRFIYPYQEQSSDSTVDFVQRAIRYFGYKPDIIQTDNGAEFTHWMDTERVHPFDQLCAKLNIEHKLIRPRTPRHNGKVERSHRNDSERFYAHLTFYSYDDLKKQMKAYLTRSNNIPMRVLGWRSPMEQRHFLERNSALQ